MTLQRSFSTNKYVINIFSPHYTWVKCWPYLHTCDDTTKIRWEWTTRLVLFNCMRVKTLFQRIGSAGPVWFSVKYHSNITSPLPFITIYRGNVFMLFLKHFLFSLYRGDSLNLMAPSAQLLTGCSGVWSQPWRHICACCSIVIACKWRMQSLHWFNN